jgi:hypothetical protein
MNMKIFKLFGFLYFLMGALSAGAQTYPSQPIKLIMPFSAGTASENAVRLLLDKLSENLKQAIVLENRPGAGSTLGTEQAAPHLENAPRLLAREERRAVLAEDVDEVDLRAFVRRRAGVGLPDWLARCCGRGRRWSGMYSKG